MSTFQVQDKKGTKHTVNAFQVTAVSEHQDGTLVVGLTDGSAIEVEGSTYRSVRGYLKKALGESQAASDE